ncbi:MAG: dynamin family protein [Bacteroidaceae bacterium]|nr:dynamin family protein [Bacteroidaceae bacterium]
METNTFFSQQLEKKQKMKQLLTKAEEFGWITAQEKEERIAAIESDVLTIGVIGQMKAGKSTFLNAFVFEDDVLPAATTPMTAALSVITYGPEKRVVAEFYTRDEWEEQKRTALMTVDESTNELMKSKIQAAQELVDKASRLAGRVDSLLGKSQEDSFENLIEYVGADGQYVSITKSVTIYYPKEYLKGVNIVDTPGFNDPIVSREERTKEFLKKADVVLLMLYAGRPFDATDRAILFKNVAECGIGKVLVGINKYDIPYETGETEEMIRDYVKKEILKASREMGNDSLKDILRDAEPIPLSAEMALLSHLPMSKINASDAYTKAWTRGCDNFEISSQKEFWQRSHLDDLINAIRIVIKEKDGILFLKPQNAILAKGNSKQAEISENLLQASSKIEMLKMPDDELEDMENSLSRLTKRMNKKIDSLGGDLDIALEEVVRKGKNELEDAVDASCRKMNTMIDSWGTFSSSDKIIADLDAETAHLTTRTLKRICEQITKDAQTKLQRTLDDFFMECEDLLERLEVQDFDQRQFVKNVSHKYNFTSGDGSLFIYDGQDVITEYGLLDGINDFLKGFTFGLSDVLGNVFSHSAIVANLKEIASNISSSFDPTPYLSHITEDKERIIEAVKKDFVDELLTPLQQQLSDIREKSVNKEKELEEVDKIIESLNEAKKTLAIQMETIKSFLLQ